MGISATEQLLQLNWFQIKTFRSEKKKKKKKSFNLIVDLSSLVVTQKVKWSLTCTDSIRNAFPSTKAAQQREFKRSLIL